MHELQLSHLIPAGAFIITHEVAYMNMVSAGAAQTQTQLNHNDNHVFLNTTALINSGSGSDLVTKFNINLYYCPLSGGKC